MRDKTLLAQLQALPLDAKIVMTQRRIIEWYNYWCGDVCISFSGGKDSTVLTHLVHDIYPDVPLVFSNTGLEYPEIQAFARKMGAEFLRPKMTFSEVISKYGYPIIGKEVAEAIHFARRIVSVGGGVQQEGRFKRIEIQGRRAAGKGRKWKAEERTSLSRNPRPDRLETGQPYGEHSGSQGTNGRNSLPPPREIRRIKRARKWLMGKD